MRKLNSLIFVFSFILFTGAAFGQGYTFRVLANKGDNKVKKAGSTEAVGLKTGTTLMSGDEIIVGSGSYIGLMHKTGKTTELRAAGTKTVADLEKSIASKKTSATSKYAAYLSQKMNDDGKVSLASRSNATGAVSRALVGGAIPVMVPGANNEVFGEYTIIRWKNPEGMEDGTSYIVRVQNIFEEVILENETNENSFELNFNDVPNETGLYLVTILVKGDESVKSDPPIGIKRKDSGTAEITTVYNDLSAELTEETSMNKLVLASFFEENGLLLDALTKYEEAVELSPEISDFQSLYDAFLISNGMDEAPEEADEE